MEAEPPSPSFTFRHRSAHVPCFDTPAADDRRPCLSFRRRRVRLRRPGQPAAAADAARRHPPASPARRPSPTSIRVTWSAVTGATSYDVEQAGATGDLRRAPSARSPRRSTSPRGLAPETDYRFRVRALRTGEQGPFSTEATVRDLQPHHGAGHGRHHHEHHVDVRQHLSAHAHHLRGQRRHAHDPARHARHRRRRSRRARRRRWWRSSCCAARASTPWAPPPIRSS